MNPTDYDKIINMLNRTAAPIVERENEYYSAFFDVIDYQGITVSLSIKKKKGGLTIAATETFLPAIWKKEIEKNPVQFLKKTIDKLVEKINNPKLDKR